MRRALILGLGVLVLVAGLPGIGSASGPQFEVYVPENILSPGEETSIDVEIRNAASPEDDDSDADATPTTQARDVTVTLDGSGTPISVRTAETPVPTLAEQNLVTETFTVAVDEGATAGTYTIDAHIDYSYTDSGGTERTRSTTEPVVIRIDERARFAVRNVTSGLSVGDTGTVQVELENTGVENASNAVVQFAAPDQQTTITAPTSDDSPVDVQAGEDYIGTWTINETATASALVDITPEAVARSYPISMTVQFRDSNGVERTSRELRVGAETTQQRLALRSLESQLRVGEEGQLRGELRNLGDTPLRDVVLVADTGDSAVPGFDGISASSGTPSVPNARGVAPQEAQYAIDRLEPNASKPLDMRIAVGRDAEPGDRLLTFDVRYRTDAGGVYWTQNPVDAQVSIAPERNEFAVNATNTAITAGGTESIRVTLTNQRNETLSNIEAKAFVNAPLDVGDNDEAFVPELRPNETTTVSFDVSVDGGTTAQTYPLRLDFRYDDTRGTSQLSDTYRVPVTVVTDESLPWLLIGGVGLGIISLVGVWWYRQPEHELPAQVTRFREDE